MARGGWRKSTANSWARRSPSLVRNGKKSFTNASLLLRHIRLTSAPLARVAQANYQIMLLASVKMVPLLISLRVPARCVMLSVLVCAHARAEGRDADSCMRHTNVREQGEREAAGRVLQVTKRSCSAKRYRLTSSLDMQAFARMPGYTAFMPESGANQHACAHATDHAHADPKNCRLFTLHQHRLNIPGTGIFQARDAANLKAPPKGRVGTASHFNVGYQSLTDLHTTGLSVCVSIINVFYLTTGHVGVGG